MDKRTANANVKRALKALAVHAPGKTPTEYQKGIIDFAINRTGHGVVKAVPGSGKSTTLEWAVVGINAQYENPKDRPSILVLAFNKSIADEMAGRLSKHGNCRVKTLNGLGHGFVMNDWRFKKARFTPTNGDKPTAHFKALCKFDELDDDGRKNVLAMSGPAVKLIALFKSFGFGAFKPLPTFEDACELADRFDVEFPEESVMPARDFVKLVVETFDRSNRDTSWFEYEDQLYLPVAYGMLLPKTYRYILVDESQDLNPIQIEMVRRMTGQNTRVLFVGDEWQAIYGFRGADPEAIATVEKTFETTSLPLSISWRCPAAVVRRAAKINPAIEAAPDAPEGSEATVKEDVFHAQVRDGDMVVCRTCAPLVEQCFALIRGGMKAYIQGSDIGKGLVGTLNKIARKHGAAGSPWGMIDAYREAELMKIKDEEKAARLSDRLDTLAILAEGCDTVADVVRKIETIFADNRAGVKLSTIHRAKGLEARNVWILHPELLPHPMARKEWSRKQEINLEYVAVTRAIENLRWVVPARPRWRGNGEVA